MAKCIKRLGRNGLQISLLSLACAMANQSVHAELVSMDDEVMEGVTGQTGLTIEIHRQSEISEVLYSDKDATTGSIIDFKDIVMGDPTDVHNVQAKTVHTIDVDGNDGIVVRSYYDPTRVQIGSISVGDHRGTPVDGYATRRSFGTVMYDFEGYRELKIQGRPAGDQGLTINSTTNITNSDLRWQTNGHTLLVDNLAYNSVLTDMTIDVMDDGSQAYLNFGIPNFSFDFTLGGLCFAESMDCASDGSNSLGALSGALAFRNSYVKIYGGGRIGTKGIAMDSYYEIDDSQSNHLTYTDADALHMGDMSGSVTVTNFTFDVETADPVIGDHIAMQVDSVVGNFKAGDLQIGGVQIGQFEVQFDFSDGNHDSVDYQNKLKLAPGIAWAGAAPTVDAGFQTYMDNFYNGLDVNMDGLSLYTEWNLTADALYTDNGNTVNISNFQSHGRGYASLDVRNDGGATDSYLAIGFVDVQGAYSIDGLKVGKEGNDPKTNAQLQGGTELLLPMGIYPAYEFTMNGNVKMYAGGRDGSGLTFEGDILITDGTFGLTTNILNYDDGDPANDRVVGLWADDVRYEYHFKDYTLDVENNGISLIKGELWSDMDIGNLRWGDKNAGDSLGRIRIQRYQKNSTLKITAGGAGGASCIGGTGADITACETDGGYWVDKGDQGLTVETGNIWEQRHATELYKANVITWENNRNAGQNDTGTQLIIDNIYTSDGYDDTNTYGTKLTMAVDVAPTKVVNKADPTLEKIMSADGTTYTYEPTATLTDTQKANRPTGFSVSSQLQFKEMNIESVQLKHPNAAPQTVVHGLHMQNFNITSNLTATPIQ